MRSTIVGCSAALLLGASLAAAQPETPAPLIPREVFFGNPDRAPACAPPRPTHPDQHKSRADRTGPPRPRAARHARGQP